MLSALDQAALQMIEAAKEKQQARQVELKMVEGELKTVEEELPLAQQHGMSTKQSRSKARDELSEPSVPARALGNKPTNTILKRRENIAKQDTKDINRNSPKPKFRYPIQGYHERDTY